MAVGLAACVSAFHTSPCSLKVTGRFSLRSAKFTGPLSQRKGTRDATLLQDMESCLCSSSKPGSAGRIAWAIGFVAVGLNLFTDQIRKAAACFVPLDLSDIIVFGRQRRDGGK